MFAHRSPTFASRSGVVSIVKSVGIELPQLFPAERHRYGRFGRDTRRIDRRERLAAHVLIVVEKDLAGPLDGRPVHRDVVRVLPQHEPPNRLARETDRVVIELPQYRDVDVQAGAAARLYERGERQVIQRCLEPAGDFARLLEGGPIQLGLSALRLLT